MTSLSGLQSIAIHIFPNISQNKDKQTMKFGQFREYNRKNFFIQKLAEYKAGRLVPDLFLVF